MYQHYVYTRRGTQLRKRREYILDIATGIGAMAFVTAVGALPMLVWLIQHWGD